MFMQISSAMHPKNKTRQNMYKKRLNNIWHLRNENLPWPISLKVQQGGAAEYLLKCMNSSYYYALGTDKI